MNILAIETSCDETAVAVVQDGITLLSQTIATSMAQHLVTGGIVPEVASREQSRCMIPVLHQTYQELNTLPVPQHQIDAIAVTQGPGLIGSLLIGVETAKALAYAWSKPLIPVNHMLGHVYGAWLTYGEVMNEAWPKLALLVSGGHTELILMESHNSLRKVGWTLDDAAGEAFDKAAKLLDLGYPGGPAISKAAESGNDLAIPFPYPLNQKTNINFSFSGLKTALLNYRREHPASNAHDVAASFQRVVIHSLVSKTKEAAAVFGAKEVILGGGVAANTLLRQELARNITCTVRIPALPYTTDNAAVIASAAYYHNHPVDWREIQADPSLELPQ